MSTKALMLSLLLAVLFVSPRTSAATGAAGSAGTSGPSSEKNSTEATGSISGTVKDTSGAVLQGARIVLKPT
ncbi:MAG: hypothetical protein ABSD44_12830, partial [Terracidiphilus sp.]